ncbi:MAG: hypothetical protein FWD89_00350 [Firmicutes bacterium]|nr:hypothetical protein [Bacillota bacterium]
MTETQRKLEKVVRLAIKSFNDNESYLISRGLSERCICSKFAMYVERQVSSSEFRDFFVDVEYNRGAKGNEYLPKTIDDDRRIVVDLIVHKRSSDQNNEFRNLICIEIKKDTNREGLDDDKERLKIMTDSYSYFKYELGFMIVANMKLHKLEINSTFVNEHSI